MDNGYPTEEVREKRGGPREQRVPYRRSVRRRRVGPREQWVPYRSVRRRGVGAQERRVTFSLFCAVDPSEIPGV